jgi:hypothetical protein
MADRHGRPTPDDRVIRTALRTYTAAMLPGVVARVRQQGGRGGPAGAAEGGDGDR